MVQNSQKFQKNFLSKIGHRQDFGFSGNSSRISNKLLYPPFMSIKITICKVGYSAGGLGHPSPGRGWGALNQELFPPLNSQSCRIAKISEGNMFPQNLVLSIIFFIFFKSERWFLFNKNILNVI